ncbi:aliphatic sulfonate ABC transporter substrate-binding protein [Neobacillus sp. 179-C4.2 HS]|uniref:Aliphatic sulfonate ABC transporter substrate-binding protein n=1 Tax=Neobacillus driksii TaxID=3035913 RepID=A0ABV4YSU7_9BACI|nr:aliphatic sulfonate ABC transporter substrate-binding protein [Neobacillus sp. 179.-C4.2 HS]MDP5193951.1 aliphatic sulfonate ABC transporter substrate-binding protein [Neobacillus sp. 179.-C4.2 HS]
MLKKSMLYLFITILFIGLLSGCAQSSNEGEGKGNSGEAKTVKIGYFPNLTHIATIVALENGYFEEAFGKDVKIETKTVANGGLFMEAMATKAIDVGTVGPGPLLNFYVKNKEYHLISGAVNGGAVLVASEGSGVEKLEDLDGKKVAIPVIGSTQDVMLRKALKDADLKAKTSGGTVDLFAAAPADTASLFIQKQVDAAATQEPWGYVLENQANGKLLLDWDKFAWGKESTNTVVAARADFLENKDLSQKYLDAHKKAVKFIQDNPEESKEVVMKHLKNLTGKELNKDEVDAAFSRLAVTTDVNEKVIQEMADISKEAGYIPSSDIKGLIDLSLLK